MAPEALDTLRISGDSCCEQMVDLLRAGGSLPLWVTGSSMMPLLKPGRDLVRIRACGAEELKPGRILLFCRGDGALVLHRLRRVLPDGGLLMNGDAQDCCERISAAQVLGAVFEITRRGKRRPWDAPTLRLWAALWYPTRPLRPALIRLRAGLKGLLGA